jgi:hypothetical protein
MAAGSTGWMFSLFSLDIPPSPGRFQGRFPSDRIKRQKERNEERENGRKGGMDKKGKAEK